MGGIGQANGDLAAILHRGAGADAGRALDGAGVHPAVDDAPRCVVFRTEIDVTAHLRAAYFVEDEAGSGDKGTGLIKGVGRQHGRPGSRGHRFRHEIECSRVRSITQLTS